MLFHIGSNKGDTIKFSIENMQFSVVGKRADANFDTAIKGNDKILNITASVISFQFSKADPSVVIDLMDKMIAQVDGSRADLGAIQNHFPEISSPHKTTSKPDILAVLNSFERMATFRWFFCA